MHIAMALGLLLPLIGFLNLMLCSKILKRSIAVFIGCTTILLSFAIFVALLYYYEQHNMQPISYTYFQWIHFDKINSDLTLRLDALSLLMTLIITGVGFLIHVYSVGYMEDDTDFARYFACMNFFVFSMLLLVLAGDLLVLFVGWEGVGLASYLLIGFYYFRPSAAAAATKAFVINRIGDLGLLLGILLTFYLFSTTDIEEISKQAVSKFSMGAPIITILTLLLFIGAIGKSAQLPLYTWLPDAMEGPTPVSALIHAATMVTAGVYLVVRLHPIYLLAPTTLQVIGVIGGVTSLFAALCALAQTDLKKVLAYSTISQLGLMFLACGIGAFYAAMFHLTTHAFIKATLFLAAGNVVHMLHGTTEMKKMGGLAKIFTKTHLLFLIGALALSGIPPLAAFFSKDLILEQEFLAGFYWLFGIGLVASILTGIYLIRAYCLTFFGSLKVEEKLQHMLHEAPPIMIIPVAILAFLSLVGGFLGFSFEHTAILQAFLAESDVLLAEKEPSNFLTPETILAMTGAFLGVLGSAFVYTRLSNKLGNSISFLKNSFYVNELYSNVIVKPLKSLANFIADFFEPKIIDGSVHTAAMAVQGTSYELQKVQSGQIRSYVAWMAIGTVILLVYFVF